MSKLDICCGLSRGDVQRSLVELVRALRHSKGRAFKSARHQRFERGHPSPRGMCHSMSLFLGYVAVVGRHDYLLMWVLDILGLGSEVCDIYSR
eukprot:378233-Amphidinium_carterae.1